MTELENRSRTLMPKKKHSIRFLTMKLEALYRIFKDKIGRGAVFCFFTAILAKHY
jgi:hypothetical protein